MSLILYLGDRRANDHIQMAGACDFGDSVDCQQKQSMCFLLTYKNCAASAVFKKTTTGHSSTFSVHRSGGWAEPLHLHDWHRCSQLPPGLFTVESERSIETVLQLTNKA